MTVNSKSRTIKIELDLVNKGMSDAGQLLIQAKMLDSEKEISANATISNLGARKTNSMSLLFSDVTEQTIGTLNKVTSYGPFSEGRVGLRI